MTHNELHLHSMMVHAVAALAPLAAVAFVLEATGTSLASLHPEVWGLLTRASLLLLLIVALPSTLSGVFERNRMYANWHPSHRIKLVLSFALIAAVAVELAWLLPKDVAFVVASPLGVAVVVVNTLLVLTLSGYGLKITLGRLGLGRTSYIPDMHKHPPVDILEATAARLSEPAKVVDVLDELET